jgi:hypothetical protein
MATAGGVPLSPVPPAAQAQSAPHITTDKAIM